MAKKAARNPLRLGKRAPGFEPLPARNWFIRDLKAALLDAEPVTARERVERLRGTIENRIDGFTSYRVLRALNPKLDDWMPIWRQLCGTWNECFQTLVLAYELDALQQKHSDIRAAGLGGYAVRVSQPGGGSVTLLEDSACLTLARLVGYQLHCLRYLDAVELQSADDVAACLPEIDDSVSDCISFARWELKLADADDELPRIRDVHLRILDVLAGMGASETSPVRQADIAPEIDEYWDNENIKDPMSDLLHIGYTKGKRGPGGGNWPTEEGLQRLRMEKERGWNSD